MLEDTELDLPSREELQQKINQNSIEEIQNKIKDIQLVIRQLEEIPNSNQQIRSLKSYKIGNTGHPTYERIYKSVWSEQDLSYLEKELLPQLNDELTLEQYRQASSKDKKGIINKVLQENIATLSSKKLKEEENAANINALIQSLCNDITEFSTELQNEVDLPKKTPSFLTNPLETALHLKTVVNSLFDQDTSAIEKYGSILNFRIKARNSYIGPRADALIASIIIGLVILLLVALITAMAVCPPLLLKIFGLSFAFSYLFSTGAIFLLVPTSISLFITGALYGIQAYKNFPLTGGETATRGEKVSDNLVALADEMKNQHPTFGSFFSGKKEPSDSVSPEETNAERKFSWCAIV